MDNNILLLLKFFSNFLRLHNYYAMKLLRETTSSFKNSSYKINIFKQISIIIYQINFINICGYYDKTYIQKTNTVLA